MEDDQVIERTEEYELEKQRVLSRRDFLAGLRKWSTAVIGIAVAGSVLLPGESASGWVNGRGGAWVNGGGSWINRSGGGGWYNRGTAWANRGSAWVNRAGGGGGAWVNRRGY